MFIAKDVRKKYNEALDEIGKALCDSDIRMAVVAIVVENPDCQNSTEVELVFVRGWGESVVHGEDAVCSGVEAAGVEGA